MNVSFKQFATFLSQAEGQPTEKLDEIWDKILGKKKEDADKKKDDYFDRVKSAHGKLNGKKVKSDDDEDDDDLSPAEKRKKELQKKRDDEWAKAKERTEIGVKRTNGTAGTAGSIARQDRRAEVPWHRSFNEGKEAFDDQAAWKNAATAAGYKVKKLAGNAGEGDQSWGAFEDDKKMGEFTESENGWLLTE